MNARFRVRYEQSMHYTDIFFKFLLISSYNYLIPLCAQICYLSVKYGDLKIFVN